MQYMQWLTQSFHDTRWRCWWLLPLYRYCTVFLCMVIDVMFLTLFALLDYDLRICDDALRRCWLWRCLFVVKHLW